MSKKSGGMSKKSVGMSKKSGGCQKKAGGGQKKASPDGFYQTGLAEQRPLLTHHDWGPLQDMQGTADQKEKATWDALGATKGTCGLLPRRILTRFLKQGKLTFNFILGNLFLFLFQHSDQDFM